MGSSAIKEKSSSRFGAGKFTQSAESTRLPSLLPGIPLSAMEVSLGKPIVKKSVLMPSSMKLGGAAAHGMDANTTKSGAADRAAFPRVTLAEEKERSSATDQHKPMSSHVRNRSITNSSKHDSTNISDLEDEEDVVIVKHIPHSSRYWNSRTDASSIRHRTLGFETSARSSPVANATLAEEREEEPEKEREVVTERLTRRHVASMRGSKVREANPTAKFLSIQRWLAAVDDSDIQRGLRKR